MKVMRVLRVVLAVFPLLLAAQSTMMMGQSTTVMGQSTTTLNLAPGSLTPEQTELNQAVAEANGSPVDVIRVFEAHLRRYPDTERRVDLETAIYKYAVDLNDKPRIILYGEKMLANNSGDPIEILDRTLHALLASDDTEAAMKALVYAKQYEAAVKENQARIPEGHATAAQWANLGERAMARATVLEARADGNLGMAEEAVAAARRSWNLSPSAESAQETGRWLRKLGREAEAIDCYADAVMIEDSGFPWTARDGDKKVVAELYVKVHGNDQGLGDVFLRAWDRSAAAIRERTARYKAMDPNFGVTDPYQFVLTELDGNATAADALDMAKLKGKTLVLDFWATWCGPCIAQHPMIEEVKQKYSKAPDVVFLSIDSDEDRTLVKPFLEAQKWRQRVYHEGGLDGLLNVSALPTILVIDPAGRSVSRMSGLNPGTFESALSARIDEALAVKSQ
jgi:thiol-disulfide isomerase/thioredoxin